jgi:hypothetical protein
MLESDRPHVLREMIYVCRPGGVLSIPGVYGGFADKVPMGPLMNKGLTIRTGQTHVNRWNDELLRLIEGGKIDQSFVVTHTVALEQGPEMYNVFRDKQDSCIKMLIISCVAFDRCNAAAVPGEEGHARKEPAHRSPALKVPIDRYPRKRMQAVDVVGKDMSRSRCDGRRETSFPGEAEFPCARGRSVTERVGKMPNGPTQPALQHGFAVEDLSRRDAGILLGQDRMGDGMRPDGHSGLGCQGPKFIPGQAVVSDQRPGLEVCLSGKICHDGAQTLLRAGPDGLVDHAEGGMFLVARAS